MKCEFWLKSREWRGMTDRERKREFQITFPVQKKDLAPRVPLLTLGTRKIRVSETEQREREAEQRWSNSVRYGEAVTEILLKQVRASSYWILILYIYQRRAKKKKEKKKKKGWPETFFWYFWHTTITPALSMTSPLQTAGHKMAALTVIFYFELHHSFP